MKDLIKIAVILALAFASTFLIIKSTGLITEESVSAFLQQAKSINPWWLSFGGRADAIGRDGLRNGVPHWPPRLAAIVQG